MHAHAVFKAFQWYRPYPAGVASRLATNIYIYLCCRGNTNFIKTGHIQIYYIKLKQLQQNVHMYSIIKKQGICSTIYNSPSIWLAKKYRPYPGGVASRLVTDIYVAMVMPVLYDNSYSQMTQILFLL